MGYQELGDSAAVVVDELYAAHIARRAFEKLDTDRVAAMTGIYGNSNLDGQKRTEALVKLQESYTRSREEILHMIEVGDEPEPVGDEGLWWKKPKQEAG